MESIKYLPLLVDIVKEDKIDSSGYKNIRNRENKMVKILVKLKSQNMSKPRLGKFFSFKIV